MTARHRALGTLLRRAPAAILLGCACLIPPSAVGPAGVSSGGASDAAPAASSEGAGRPGTGVCSDRVPWAPEPLPGRCSDSPPWLTGSAASVHLRVDAAARGRPWSRFYEKAVAADHANTLRCTAWGRNAERALRKGHEQAGFEYVRFHGVLDDDVGAYSEDSSGRPVYRWRGVDQVYDAVVGAGMRPIVEISFTPGALASDPTKLQKLMWYGDASPNISPPKDWGRWKDFMAELVRHLENRYGAGDVRTRWYFEVWNEPSWMYSPGDAGYVELYENTVSGLLQGDPKVKVGGPAGSSKESVELVKSLLALAKTRKVKLDFVTYHCYGTDSGQSSDANGVADFNRTLMGVLANGGFTGEVINDEFGPSSRADAERDDESAASFVAKTIHLIGTDADTPPPSAFGYWTISDLYEEFNTGGALAYRGGNYGLLLKGDPRFPESYDVAKPAFNAFRLLHRMGEVQLSVSGGTTADGVNAAATLSADGRALQILVYNHVTGGHADSTQSALVALSVDGLPFANGPVRVRHTIVDRSHANSHTAWLAMGEPQVPSRDQWAALRDAAQLCYYEVVTDVVNHAWSITFPQNVYSVALIELEPPL